jgi:Domain of unknown function (DUF4178)
MQHNCEHCNDEQTIPNEIIWVDFVCSNCRNHYRNGQHIERLIGQYPKALKGYHPFQVGQKGVIEEVEWTVTGILEMVTTENYEWNEYYLLNNEGEIASLNEYRGSWTFSEEIEDIAPYSAMTKAFRQVKVDGDLFVMFADEKAKVLNCAGFFDFEIPYSNYGHKAYIKPPYGFTVEKQKDKTYIYQERYISITEINEAFQGLDLEKSNYFGSLEPNPIEILEYLKIFGAFFLLSFALFILDRAIYPEFELLSESLLIQPEILSYESQVGQSDIEVKTSSFTLEGLPSIVRCDFAAAVDNSWVSCDIALVNENTGEERHMTEDVEEYSGVEGGESWSEGDRTPSLYLCNVPAGTYYFVLSAESTYNLPVHFTAFRDHFPLKNIFFFFWAYLILFFIVLWINSYYNKKRWEDSEFSPYDNEE